MYLVGGYYIYQEKFGMTAVVKISKDLSSGDWTGFQLIVKRVLHSPWEVPKGKSFVAGYNISLTTEPSWHLEPYLSLIHSGEEQDCTNDKPSIIDSTRKLALSKF